MSINKEHVEKRLEIFSKYNLPLNLDTIKNNIEELAQIGLFENYFNVLLNNKKEEDFIPFINIQLKAIHNQLLEIYDYLNAPYIKGVYKTYKKCSYYDINPTLWKDSNVPEIVCKSVTIDSMLKMYSK